MTQIHFDPFYDSRPGTARAHGPGGGTTQAAAEHPQTYMDARSVLLPDGRALASLLPQRRGLSGWVVPQAGPNGAPVGYDAHAVRSMVVTIDPDIPGQTTQLALGELTNERLAAAAQQIGVAGWQDARLTASAQLRQAHENAARTPYSHPAAEFPSPSSATPAAARAAAPPEQFEPQSRRVVGSLRSFLETSTPPPGPTRQIDLSHHETPPPVSPPAAAGCVVTFEIENFGTHRVRYVDVIVNQGFLVLVGRGDDMYIPPSGDRVPPMALHVAGEPRVYLVLTTGIVYAYQGLTFCVLMVDRAADYAAEAE